MGRRKDETIRKVMRVSKTSYGITLPMSAMKKFGWREKQKLQLEINQKKQQIIVKDWKP